MNEQDEPIGVDENGELVYRCHWTGELVKAKDVIWTSPIIPSVKYKYASSKAGLAVRKASYIEYCNFEKNCNNCKCLKRIKHPKSPDGFLKGICQGNPINHPYPTVAIWGESKLQITFHPEDPMFMECFESRTND